MKPIGWCRDRDVRAIVDDDPRARWRSEGEAAANETEVIAASEVGLPELNDIDATCDGAGDLLEQRRLGLLDAAVRTRPPDDGDQ